MHIMNEEKLQKALQIAINSAKEAGKELKNIMDE